MTRAQILAASAIGLIAVGLLIAFVLPAWIFHPLTGNGYQFWSGIAGSFVMGGGIWTGAVTLYWRHACHAPGCLRIGRHQTADHVHVLCGRHHPDIPAAGRTLDEIHAAHHAAKHGGAHGGH